MIGLIWAQTEDGVIGHEGTMPWHLPEDLKHFKAVTLGSPVIMGRKTWDSLPENARPLPGRRNFVVTRNTQWSHDGAEPHYSVADALRTAQEGLSGDDVVWVIGGSHIFAETLPHADRVEVTFIKSAVRGDTFAPALGDEWMLDDASVEHANEWFTSTTGLEYRFARYVRTPDAETVLSSR